MSYTVPLRRAVVGRFSQGLGTNSGKHTKTNANAEKSKTDKGSTTRRKVVSNGKKVTSNTPSDVDNKKAKVVAEERLSPLKKTKTVVEIDINGAPPKDCWDVGHQHYALVKVIFDLSHSKFEQFMCAEEIKKLPFLDSLKKQILYRKCSKFFIAKDAAFYGGHSAEQKIEEAKSFVNGIIDPSTLKTTEIVGSESTVCEAPFFVEDPGAMKAANKVLSYFFHRQYSLMATIRASNLYATNLSNPDFAKVMEKMQKMIECYASEATPDYKAAVFQNHEDFFSSFSSHDLSQAANDAKRPYASVLDDSGHENQENYASHKGRVTTGAGKAPASYFAIDERYVGRSISSSTKFKNNPDYDPINDDDDLPPPPWEEEIEYSQPDPLSSFNTFPLEEIEFSDDGFY